ncbi:hypothetical protein [Gymnodinialimonas hymeniacidonis]|uniref:hypothetical protein n=1 Tax=Gymnodinialimonas hymeniacidonis TaxID=3126508 RepID=UPI0034C6D3AC
MVRSLLASFLALGLASSAHAEDAPPILDLPFDLAMMVGGSADALMDRLTEHFPDHRIARRNLIPAVEDEAFWMIDGTLLVSQDPLSAFGLACTQYGRSTLDFFAENRDLSFEAETVLHEADIRIDDGAVWPGAASAVLNCRYVLAAPTHEVDIALDESLVDATLADWFETRVWQDDPLGLGSDIRQADASGAVPLDGVLVESATVSLSATNSSVAMRSFALAGGV